MFVLFPWNFEYLLLPDIYSIFEKLHSKYPYGENHTVRIPVLFRKLKELGCGIRTCETI